MCPIHLCICNLLQNFPICIRKEREALACKSEELQSNGNLHMRRVFVVVGCRNLCRRHKLCYLFVEQCNAPPTLTREEKKNREMLNDLSHEFSLQTLRKKINCRQFHIAKSLTDFWSNASQNFSYLLDKIAIALSSSPAIYKMKLP